MKKILLLSVFLFLGFFVKAQLVEIVTFDPVTGINDSIALDVHDVLLVFPATAHAELIVLGYTERWLSREIMDTLNVRFPALVKLTDAQSGSKFLFGSYQVREIGQNNDGTTYILSKETRRYTVSEPLWQVVAAMQAGVSSGSGVGDDLGSHILEQTLQGAGYDATNFGLISADSLSIIDQNADTFGWTITESATGALSFIFNGSEIFHVDTDGSFGGNYEFPATIGPSGEVLVSDGTNYVSSTIASVQEYDAGNGCRVIATGTGVTFTVNAGAGTGVVAIPSGVRILSARMDGDTSYAHFNGGTTTNGFQVTFDFIDADVDFNDDRTDAQIPVASEVWNTTIAAPTTSSFWTKDTGAIQHRIVTVGSGDLIYVFNSINVYTNWMLVFKF